MMRRGASFLRSAQTKGTIPHRQGAAGARTVLLEPCKFSEVRRLNLGSSSLPGAMINCAFVERKAEASNVYKLQISRSRGDNPTIVEADLAFCRILPPARATFDPATLPHPTITICRAKCQNYDSSSLQLRAQQDTVLRRDNDEHDRFTSETISLSNFNPENSQKDRSWFSSHARSRLPWE